VPVCYEVDATAGLIRVHFVGAISLADIFGYYSALSTDAALRPNLGVLADCREVTAVPSFGELSVIATAEGKTDPALRPTRGAAVVSSPWMFGIVRQFAALAEPSGARVVPFYDMEAAERWLRSELEGACVEKMATETDGS
jgi:hypothetical protein